MPFRLKIAALAVAALAATEAPSEPPVVAGSRAPSFALVGASVAAGGELPTLVVFLDFEEARAPGTGASDREADALCTLRERYGDRFVRTVIVDPSGTIARGATPVDDLALRVRAWGLERFPVVQDHEAAGLALRYGVTKAPALFLVDALGIVRNRWDRFVDSTELAVGVSAVRPRR